MSILQPGTIHTLTVARKIETGYVLTNGKIEVLLHINEANDSLDVNDDIEVFLYKDKKGQLVATMAIPDATVDTYGWGKVVEVVKNLGVFVNIGIQKEILVSKDDLPLMGNVWPKPGDELWVTLTTDKRGRLLAKPVTEDVADQEWETAPKEFQKQLISGRVFRATKIGSVIITEEGYRGFIHHTERKREPRLGEWVKGRVIEVKEDGTLNVSLLPLKQDALVVDAEEIMNFLLENNGEMPFTDKSDPQEIRETFNMSKAAFKRALGRLLKENKIEQKDSKTILL